MPDENNPAVDSSTPAPVMVEAPHPESPEYADWRYSGRIPEAPKPKSEAPAPSKTVKTAPVSETGHQQQEPRPSKAERRLNELLEDLRHAGLSPSELKTFKREAQKAADAEKPSEQTVKPADGPKRPKYEDFKTLEEYQSAEDKYLEDKLEYKLQQERARQYQEALRRKGAEELDAASKRYGEESRRVIVETATEILGDNDKQPPLNPVLAQLLGESPVLADMMYVIGSKADDKAEFIKEAKTAPGKAIRRAVLLEKLVQEELAKSVKPARVSESEEEFEEEPPPAKKVTKAPAPPREASGAAAAPPDEVFSAVAAGDARRYFKEANRRDLQRRRAG